MNRVSRGCRRKPANGETRTCKDEGNTVLNLVVIANFMLINLRSAFESKLVFKSIKGRLGNMVFLANFENWHLCIIVGF